MSLFRMPLLCPACEGLQVNCPCEPCQLCEHGFASPPFDVDPAACEECRGQCNHEWFYVGPAMDTGVVPHDAKREDFACEYCGCPATDPYYDKPTPPVICDWD